jgi:mannose-6-phosphate isomerase-like protein (cupin superfamily)
MLMLTWLVALAALAQAGQAPAAAAAPATSMALRVTDRTGMTLESAHVTAEGPVSRDGTTDRNGGVTFKSLNAGTYRLRVERDGFYTLEKEVVVKAGVTTSTDAALSAAPPPPPPAPAPVQAPAAPAAPVLVPGEPKVLSITDLAEKELVSKDVTRETPIGCSGATAVRLILTRDAVASHTHADGDETLYVVAGEASLKLAGQDYALAAGSLALVPRGADHSLTRKGKNPVIVLSTLNGPACPKK